MSKFWEFVSSVSDDIRNDVRREVVERPWYGTPTTGSNTMQPEQIETQEAPQIAMGNAPYEEVWGEEPEAADLYGDAPQAEAPEEPEPEPPEPEIEPET